jgi:acyl carrier protein
MRNDHGKPMTPEDITKAIVEELASIAPDLDVGSIAANDHFLDDLGIDSMDFLNLLAALQRRLSLSIPEADFSRLTSVAALSSYLSKKLV